MRKRILLLVALVVIVFYPCLNASFINLDDDVHILNNTALHDLSLNSIKQIFAQTPNNTYIPLTSLSFAIERYFFGLNPFIFHLDNLLFYIGVVVLGFLLAERIGFSVEASFWAMLIFAIHPMRVETVAWVTERKDVLYAFLYVLALHQYWSYLKTKAIKYYLATVFLGFLSILAKPMALSLPLILLLFDWFYGRVLSKGVLIEKIPVLLYVVIIAGISYALNMGHHSENILPQGMLIWIWSLGFYLWKFFFPFHVCSYYALPHPVSIFHWPYLGTALLLSALIFLLVRFQRNKLFIFAFLYFFCSIFFLLRFDEIDFNMVADRFMFLPSLGICFWVGAWIAQHIRSKWGRTILYILLVLTGVKTNLQCHVWHDSISFWNEVIAEHPTYYRAYNNRGLAFCQQGREDLALNDYNRAIVLNPNASVIYNNRGIIYYHQGADQKAFEDFNKAIALNPTFPNPYLNRSMLEEAEKSYHPALEDALYAKKLGGLVADDYLKRLQSNV